MNKLKIMASYMTDIIYCGKTKDLGNGLHEFVGEKIDVTNDVLSATFQWFINKLKKTKNCNEFKISYPNSEYELILRKKEESK